MTDQNISRTKRTSQAIDNFSFDEDFLVKVVELVKRNQAGTAIEYFSPATEEKQDDVIVNQETLISLIGTLQELSQRLAPLASAMNSGAPGLRVTPNAATLPVSGTVTATVASTSITNFGTGIPASEMAHDMNNIAAVLSNINNATA